MNINYFAGGNTAQGFVDFFKSNLQGLEKIYILKGGPGTGKSSMMKFIGKIYEDKDFAVEYIHCSSDPDSLDGIIIPAIKAAVVDGTAPHVIEPSAPGAIEEYVNLGAAWDNMKLKNHKAEILSLKETISECFDKSYQCFAEALKIHDEWEKIYIENMNFLNADMLISQTIDLILKDNKFEKISTVKQRFFGASTPLGSLDFIENITAEISKRYLLKGRPGTGKSTLLKKAASAAAERGINVNIYHCAFDSKSLDMLIFPELDVCIFDSTAPHLYDPSKSADEIIDMYEKCILPGTDEKYEKEIQDINKRYKDTVQKGIQYLADAKQLHDELEKYYMEAMDFKIIDIIRDKIIQELDALMF